MDAIDELVARSKKHEALTAFHASHKANPQVLSFLISEIRLRLARGLDAFSFGSLVEYCRWKLQVEKGPGETFAVNDRNAAFYARAIVILCHEFNGRCEFRASKADAIFGVELAPEKRPGDYARRLQWAGSIPIERGWRPQRPHTVQHVATKADIHTR